MGNQTVDGQDWETIYGSKWGPSTLWLLTFFNISYFVSTEIHTGSEQLKGQ